MIVLIEDIKEGMVCAQSIVHKTGMIIIPAETVLTEKHVDILKKWGVSQVIIKDKQNNISFSEVDINVARAKVTPRFIVESFSELENKIEELAVKWRITEDRQNNE